MNLQTKRLLDISNAVNTASGIAICARSLATGNHAYYKGDARPLTTRGKVKQAALLGVIASGMALQVKQRVSGKPEERSAESELGNLLAETLTRSILLSIRVKEVATGISVSPRKANRLPISALSRTNVAIQVVLNSAIVGMTTYELYLRRDELLEVLREIRRDVALKARDKQPVDETFDLNAMLERLAKTIEQQRMEQQKQ